MNLIKNIKTKDKVIKTTQGDFKIRKNGRLELCIAHGTANFETVRVTPLSTQPQDK